MRRRSIALVSPAVEALRTIDAWGAQTAAAGVTRADAELGDPWAARDAAAVGVGDEAPDRARRRSSRSEEGTVDLDEPAGPPGSTLRHLLAHASGLPFEDGPPLAPPGRRRIYSNVGIEAAAELVAARAEMPFADYLRAAVLEPLALAGDAARLAGVGLRRPARRPAGARPGAARADARRRRDARRGDLGAVPRARRRAAGLRPDGPERLGARVRAARPQGAALDGRAQLAAHVRPLRRARARSSGSIRTPASPAPCSPTASSATGRRRRGRPSTTRCSPKPAR